MPLAKRVIPCLDVDHGRVVKGVNFLNLKKAGDPVELAKRYSDDGADELVFLDVTASPEKRAILRKVVEDVARTIDIPFTVGGGLQNVQDARLVLCSGADKISVNTAAVENPEIIAELAETFGQQCVVVAIDAKRRYDNQDGMKTIKTADGTCWFEVYTYGGRKPTGIDVIQWSKKAAELGAGEFLLTSMDKDGTEKGYDLDLTDCISKGVNIPVIASGGAGRPEHLLEAFLYGHADAALAASIFHYSMCPIPQVKEFLRENGVTVRI